MPSLVLPEQPELKCQPQPRGCCKPSSFGHWEDDKISGLGAYQGPAELGRGGGALGACVPTVIPRPSTPAIFCRYGKEKRSKNRQSTNLYYCTPPSCSTFHRPWCHSDAYLFNKHYLHIIRKVRNLILLFPSNCSISHGIYLLLSCRLLGKFQMICDISSKFCGLLRKPEL